MTPSLRPTVKIVLAFFILAFGGISAWILRNNENTKIVATHKELSGYEDTAFLEPKHIGRQDDASIQNITNIDNAQLAPNTRKATSTRDAVPMAFWEYYEKQSDTSPIKPEASSSYSVSVLPFEPSLPQASYAQAYQPPTLNSANLVPSTGSSRTSGEKEGDQGFVHEVRKPKEPENAAPRLDILPSAATRNEDAEPLPTGADFRIAEDNALNETLTTAALPPLPETAPPSPPETAEVLVGPRYLLKPLPEVLDENHAAQTELADPVPGLLQMVPLDQIPVVPSPFDRAPSGGHDCVMVPIKSLPPVDEALSPFNPKRQAENPRNP